jgi:hypothetical protein
MHLTCAGSNCNSWSGGKADFTSANGNWIYAFHASGGPKNSDDQKATFIRHDSRDAFQWSYANAKGGDSVNPLVNAAPAGSGSGSGAAAATSCVPRPANTAGSAITSAATATPIPTTTKSGGDDDDNRSWRGRPTWASQWWSGRPTAAPTAPPSVHDSKSLLKKPDVS